MPGVAKLISLLSLVLMSWPPARADWVSLLNGKDLDGWEVIGDGVWTVMRDGTLVGQRDILQHSEDQSWLYTKKEYGAFDLHVEWWLRWRGNSGVSVRDTSRARYACGAQWDPHRTPSHIGYEIQISNGDNDEYQTGSVYLFDKAKTGFQHDNDWNTLDIESRHDGIRVKLNGHPVAQYAGEPGRPTTGPIGLQLHDRTTVAMFRNIRIREIPAK